jgi:hypothetical protein
MKNIKIWKAPKYEETKTGFIFKKPVYKEVQEGIYLMDAKEQLYVASLSFEQEPEFEEGENAADISQYPLEDILDKYLCHISDFYEDLNTEDKKTCVLEFASERVADVQGLMEIVGKHVYNKDVEEDGAVYSKLVIE